MWMQHHAASEILDSLTLSIVQSSKYKKTQRFRTWISILPPSSVSETLCFLVFRIPDNGQSPKTQFFVRILHFLIMLIILYLQLNSEQYEALIEKLQSERDFYYSECCRLKEQRAVTASCTNVSGGTKFLQEAHESQYMRDICSSRFFFII
jgi:hypothetical protein